MWFDVEGLASYLKIVAFTIPFSTWMGLNSEAFRGMKEMVSYSIYQRGTVLLLAILAIYLGDSFYPSTPELTIFSYGIGVAALAFASGVFTPIKVRSLGEPSSTSSDFKAASMLSVAFPCF